MAPQWDRWYILGTAYDLQDFNHPGGKEFLNLGKGRDATFLIMSYHLVEARTLLKRLEPYSRPQEPRWGDVDYDRKGVRAEILDDPVLKATKSAVNEYMCDLHAKCPTARKEELLGAPWICLSISAAFFVPFVIFLVLWWRGSVLAGFLASGANWIYGINLTHDGSHGAVFRGPAKLRWLNVALVYLSLPFFYEPWSWMLQHVYSHHLHTNDLHLDCDTHYLDSNFVGRIDPKREVFRPWYPFTWVGFLLSQICITCVWEVILVPVVRVMAAMVFAISQLLPDPLSRHVGSWAHIIGARFFGGVIPNAYEGMDLTQGLRSLLGSAVGGLFFLAPLLHPLVSTRSMIHTAMLCVGPWIASSTIFIVVTQASHLQQRCLDAARVGGKSWGAVQALTSLNYGVESRLCSWLTGGLNLQSVHHSAPFVHSWHYKSLYPYMKRAWKPLGIEPPEASGLAVCFGYYIQQLFVANMRHPSVNAHDN